VSADFVFDEIRQVLEPQSRVAGEYHAETKRVTTACRAPAEFAAVGAHCLARYR